FLQSGAYEPKPSVHTLANAMDVGNPSNWVRIQDLFRNNLEELREIISSYTYDDEETKAAMDELYAKYRYIACPHTAIAYLASNAYNAENPGEYASVFLSTAHPCKFPDAISETVFSEIQLPEGATSLEGKQKLAQELAVDYDSF